MISEIKKKIDELKKYKNKITKDHYLVLDIGTKHLKGLEITRKGTELLIKNKFMINGMERYYNGREIEDVNGIIETLIRVLRMKKIDIEKVDVLFTSSNLETKIIKVPDMEDKEIKNFVALEYQKQFQGQNQSTHIMDYMPLGRVEDDRMDIMVLIASLPTVESNNIYRNFEKNKVQVRSIEVDIHALGNALLLTHLKDECKTILHLGNDTSLLLFIKEQTIIYYRSFNFGFNTLVKQIQKELKCPLRNAETIVRDLGFSFDENYETELDKEIYYYLMKKNFGDFLKEVYKSIDYVKIKLKLQTNSLYLAGGLSNTKDLSRFINESIGMRSKLWNFKMKELKSGFTVTNDSDNLIGPEYAMCLGVAVREVMK